MQHRNEDKEFLDSLTNEQKNERTKLESFKERWKLVKEFMFRYLTENEMPYLGTHKHFVLWQKDFITQEAYIEFFKIMESYKWYTIKRSSLKNKSCQREHWHIFK